MSRTQFFATWLAMERRLALDVVGYSRMVEADEAGTLAALRTRRKTILEPLVAQHHGRIVKLMGTGSRMEASCKFQDEVPRSPEFADGNLSEMDEHIVPDVARLF
jgi:class 3 adenylate cyclase